MTGTTDGTGQNTQHRSYSQLNQLRKCGWQYKLERVDRKPRRPSVPAVAGKIVHSGTEDVDQAIHAGNSEREFLLRVGLEACDKAAESVIPADSKNFPPEEWKRYGRKTLEKPEAEDLAWFRSVGIPNAIQAYVDWRLANLDTFVLAEIPGFGPAIEVPFMHYVGGQLVHGWIDRVFTHPEAGGYYPVDLKSGRKPDSSEQLGLYGAFLKKALGWDCTWGYYLYGLKTGEAKLTSPINLTHWTDEKLASIYVPATRMIDQGLYVPNPGENCFHCGVSAECEFAQASI